MLVSQLYFNFANSLTLEVAVFCKLLVTLGVGIEEEQSTGSLQVFNTAEIVKFPSFPQVNGPSSDPSSVTCPVVAHLRLTVSPTAGLVWVVALKPLVSPLSAWPKCRDENIKQCLACRQSEYLQNGSRFRTNWRKNRF